MRKSKTITIVLFILAFCSFLNIHDVRSDQHNLFFEHYEDAVEHARSCQESHGAPYEGKDCYLHPCWYPTCKSLSEFDPEQWEQWGGSEQWGGASFVCFWYNDDWPEWNCYFAKSEPEDCECTKILNSPQQCPKKFSGNPINIRDGYNFERETDLSFNTAFEEGFKVYRIYNSQKTTDQRMGIGWTHNYGLTISPLQYSQQCYLVSVLCEYHKWHTYYVCFSSYPSVFNSVNSAAGYFVAESEDIFTWHRPNGMKYTFNSIGRLISKEDGRGNQQTLTYNTDGFLESVTDHASGRTIVFHYNDQDMIEYISGPVTDAVPDGIWVNYEYDGDGNLTRVIYADDENGSTASGFEYLYEDANDVHNITEKRNLADEFLSSWQYNSGDEVYSSVTRDGKGVQINHANHKYNITVHDAQGSWKRYTYDSIKRTRTLVTITGKSGACSNCGSDVVRYGYDDERRLNEIEYANGRIDQYTDFDAKDRYQTEIQAVGTAKERTLYYTYHPESGDRLSIYEASILASDSAKETIFDYDDDGNDTPNENPTRLMHRKIERGFTYDIDGVVVPYAHITLLAYTAKGQVASVDGPLPGDQDKIDFTYDPATGDLLTVTQPLVGTTTLGHDAAGNVTQITDVNGIETTLTYDGRNRPISATSNGTTISLTYTAAGELDAATDALNRTLDYTYNPAGFIEKVTDPSGDYLFFDYNALGFPTETSLHAADNTQTLYSGIDYGDPATNPELVSRMPWKSRYRNHDDSTDLETVYTYNSSGHLTSITDANQHTTSFQYDLFGRINQVIQPGGLTTIYSQGGHSGEMFSLAAQSWAQRNPGSHTIVPVSSGQQAIQAMQTYAQLNGSIDGLQVFSHSSNYGIFFNQGSGAQSLYTGNPSNAGSGAASIADIRTSWFDQNADVNLWGCNTGWGQDSFAQKLANRIGIDVTGATGPTAFSGVPNGAPGQGLPTPVPGNYSGPVHMVPQYSNQGYTSFSPQRGGWYYSIRRFFGI